MSRSYHVTERLRRRDKIMNRDDCDKVDPSLSRLDELSLKKSAAKDTEKWKRAAARAGGVRRAEFTFTESGLKVQKQKMRGVISDVPGAVIAPKKKEPNHPSETTRGK